MASAAQMRAFLSTRGVNVRALLEKTEVVEAYKTSLFRRPSSPSANGSMIKPVPSVPIHTFDKKVAGLDCIVKTNSQKPDFVVCVFHGFGANKEDLADLCDSVLRSSPGSVDLGCAVVVPDGKLRLMEHSYGWWPIDVGRLAENIMKGNVKEIVDSVPEGIAEVRNNAVGLVNEACALFEVPPSQVALWGFSQGSMLSLDLLMHLENPPMHLGLFSCGPMCQSMWRTSLRSPSAQSQRLKTMKNVCISQTHGTQDFIIPIMGGRLVNKFLEEEGFNCEYQEFNGGHTLPANIKKIEERLLEAAVERCQNKDA